MNNVRWRGLKMSATFYVNMKSIMILDLNQLGEYVKEERINFLRLDVADQLSFIFDNLDRSSAKYIAKCFSLRKSLFNKNSAWMNCVVLCSASFVYIFQDVICNYTMHVLFWLINVLLYDCNMYLFNYCIIKTYIFMSVFKMTYKAHWPGPNCIVHVTVTHFGRSL